ncbi:low affinity iron permease family protein [Polluticoccus soli]|uniref:low affinity iron permease family protein n=1 Tax=Polluticoccus soli TaxID=3034150 RepID=UPI0023E228C4|nr:low affinity iron permease family protein [Flavipsychrobacter sp. JY13-12]
MEVKHRNKLYNIFDKFSNKVTKATGSPLAFIIALTVIVIWALTGPIFGFSDTWQLIINTGTTIVTFLMVFIIQQSQNKDTIALHLKLNELIAASKNASNRLIDSEDLTEEELETIKKFYVELSALAEKETNIYTSHSIDEARKHHGKKMRRLVSSRKAEEELEALRQNINKNKSAG